MRTYADTADGLRQFLLSTVEIARNGNTDQLRATVKGMEIPDYEHWFTRTFGKEKGESSSGPYGKFLQEREADFTAKILQLARESGDVSVEKLDTKKMFYTLTEPLDYFFARWTLSSPAGNQKPEPIGCFYFIDGRFRWDSTVQFVTVIPRTESPTSPNETSEQHAQPGGGGATAPPLAVAGRDGVGFPRCSYCPAAELPHTKHHPKGNVTVQLEAIVDVDGRATDIKVLRTGGSDFDAKAIEAVQRWRFTPALTSGGDPVAVLQVIEITFQR